MQTLFLKQRSISWGEGKRNLEIIIIQLPSSDLETEDKIKGSDLRGVFCTFWHSTSNVSYGALGRPGEAWTSLWRRWSGKPAEAWPHCKRAGQGGSDNRNIAIPLCWYAACKAWQATITITIFTFFSFVIMRLGPSCFTLQCMYIDDN